MLLPLSASVPALWNEYLTPLFACGTQPPFRQFVIDSPSSGGRSHLVRPKRKGQNVRIVNHPKDRLERLPDTCRRVADTMQYDCARQSFCLIRVDFCIIIQYL
jgi:hypothetical protein